VCTPSTSTTASLTQAAEDVEPEVTVSDPAMLLTSCEWAKDVVERGLLTLGPKLAVFTVVGTQEPRLVKLFPRVSCSCPATATCYHIMAAKMAVGMTVPDARMGTINLMQMRRNKWKRTDKTSDRKQPRLRDVDVDVEPADDIAALLIVVVTGSSQSSETASPQSSECDTQQVAESDQPPATDANAIDPSICHTCD